MIMKALLISIITICGILAAGVGLKIPTFVYNEIEAEERFNFLMAEEGKKQIDEMVALRVDDVPNVLLSVEGKAKVMQEIEQGLDVINGMVNEYGRLLIKQDSLPLLPKEYKNYQQLKKPGYEKYKSAVALFHNAKQTEYGVYKLISQVDELSSQVVSSVELPMSEFDKQIEVLATSADRVIETAKYMRKEGQLNQGLYEHVLVRAQGVIDLRDITKDYRRGGQDKKYEVQLKAIGDRIDSVDFESAIDDWIKHVRDPLFDQSDKDYKEAVTLMTKADDYYRNNDLKRDFISSLLSIFSERFPKNI